MTKTFAERCQLAQQFLPDAQYKAMLTALHTEMLAKLAEQPAQRKPLTDEQLRAMCNQAWVFETVRQWSRVIEAAHGITKGNT